MFGRRLAVGRGAPNDLVLDEPTASGVHAVIEWRHSAYFVRDLDSRNGTRVGDEPVSTWRRLRKGEVISFGPDARWVVESLEPPAGGDGQGETSTESGGVPVRLALLRGADGGEVRVEAGRRTASWPGQGLRFDLLWVLAERRRADEAAGHSDPGWIADGALESALWGRAATELHPNTLHKLIGDTRDMLAEQSVDRRLVQKSRGRTRLRLGADRVELRG